MASDFMADSLLLVYGIHLQSGIVSLVNTLYGILPTHLA